jgi:hypothetical protein
MAIQVIVKLLLVMFVLPGAGMPHVASVVKLCDEE